MKKVFNLFLCFFILVNSNNLLYTSVYNLVGNNQTRYITSTDKDVQSSARGFAFFTNGIIFDGTVNVALPIPINGNVQFGNGSTCKINLETDLTFGATAGTTTNTIKINTSDGSAEINGTGGTIVFESDTFFPSSRAFRISSNLTIDGGGHDMVFGNLLTFSIDAGVNLTIRDAHLRGLNTLNFVGEGSLTLYNVIVTLDYDWTFSGNASIGAPELIFDDYTTFNGYNKKFIYASGRNMEVISDSTITFDTKTTFSWATHRRHGLLMDTIENNLPGNGACLFFMNSDFYVPSRGADNGLQLKKGSLAFQGSCNIYNDGTSDVNKSLEVGDGASASNNTDVFILCGAQVEVDGYIFENSA